MRNATAADAHLRASLSDSEPWLFQRKRIVPHDAIDELGHVNNVRWIDMIVNITVDHSIACGFDLDALRAIGGVWVVRKHTVEYLYPALEGEEVCESTWLTEVRGARSFRSYSFVNAQSGLEYVRAQTEWVFTSLTGRPKRIPKQIADAFAIMPTP